jgi:hypothetical protein
MFERPRCNYCDGYINADSSNIIGHKLIAAHVDKKLVDLLLLCHMVVTISDVPRGVGLGKGQLGGIKSHKLTKIHAAKKFPRKRQKTNETTVHNFPPNLVALPPISWFGFGTFTTTS